LSNVHGYNYAWYDMDSGNYCMLVLCSSSSSGVSHIFRGLYRHCCLFGHGFRKNIEMNIPSSVFSIFANSCCCCCCFGKANLQQKVKVNYLYCVQPPLSPSSRQTGERSVIEFLDLILFPPLTYS